MMIQPRNQCSSFFPLLVFESSMFTPLGASKKVRRLHSEAQIRNLLYTILTDKVAFSYTYQRNLYPFHVDLAHCLK